MTQDFHVSSVQPLCPLCGLILDVPAHGSAAATLSELANHFARDCAAIAVLPPSGGR